MKTRRANCDGWSERKVKELYYSHAKWHLLMIKVPISGTGCPKEKQDIFCALPSKRLSEKWKLNSNKRKTALTFCCRLFWSVCWFEFCRSFPERKQGITRCSPELVRPVNEPVSCTFIRKTCDVNKNKNKKENSYLVLEGPSSKKKCTRLLCVYL